MRQEGTLGQWGTGRMQGSLVRGEWDVAHRRHRVLFPMQWAQTSPWRPAARTGTKWPRSTATARCPTPRTRSSAGACVVAARGRLRPSRGKWGKKGQCAPPGCAGHSGRGTRPLSAPWSSDCPVTGGVAPFAGRLGCAAPSATAQHCGQVTSLLTKRGSGGGGRG